MGPVFAGNGQPHTSSLGGCSFQNAPKRFCIALGHTPNIFHSIRVQETAQDPGPPKEDPLASQCEAGHVHRLVHWSEVRGDRRGLPRLLALVIHGRHELSLQ